MQTLHSYTCTKGRGFNNPKAQRADRIRSLPSKLRPLDADHAAGDADEAGDGWTFFITTIDGLVAIHLASFCFATLNLVEKNERQIASISPSHCRRQLEEPPQRDRLFYNC